MGTTAIMKPIPMPVTNLAIMNIVMLMEPAQSAAPMTKITAPIRIEYFRDNLSADQALKSTPSADAAELRPSHVSKLRGFEKSFPVAHKPFMTPKRWAVLP